MADQERLIITQQDVAPKAIEIDYRDVAEKIEIRDHDVALETDYDPNKDFFAARAPDGSLHIDQEFLNVYGPTSGAHNPDSDRANWDIKAAVPRDPTTAEKRYNQQQTRLQADAQQAGRTALQSSRIIIS